MALTLVTKPLVQSLAGQINRPALNQWAPIPLRLIVGYGFIVHGYAKLSRGPETFAVILHTIGVPFPYLMAWLTSTVETDRRLRRSDWRLRTRRKPANDDRVADRYVHDPSAYGFFSAKLVEVTANGKKFGPVGYEIILLYLTSLVALASGGAGPLSVDRWLEKRLAMRLLK